MFPNFQIAKSFHQAETNTKYMIQCEITPYERKKVIEDFNGQPFKFNETTSS